MKHFLPSMIIGGLIVFLLSGCGGHYYDSPDSSPGYQDYQQRDNCDSVTHGHRQRC